MAPHDRSRVLRFLLVRKDKDGNRLEVARKRMRSRRRAILLLAISSVLVPCGEFFVPNPRNLWMYSRSTHWWEDVVLSNFGHHDWMENFRMSRDTFQYLCDQLRPQIERKNTRMRRSVSTERRVALWVLATPAEYRSVAHLSGLARCTVCVIVNETFRAIVRKLLPMYIRFPSDGLKVVVSGFKEKLGIPQCAGSIDGSHIPITPPAMNHTDYYNRKGWYSVLVQAVVDHNYLFIDLCIGWPGSVHDARVLANSSVFRKVTSGELLQGEELQVQEQTLRTFLIGDSAYPFFHG